jgi:hypothetical protein
LIAIIIHQAEIDKKTQTRDQIIQFFAFFIFSSSHQEITSKKEPYTIIHTAKTPKTEAIFIVH